MIIVPPAWKGKLAIGDRSGTVNEWTQALSRTKTLKADNIATVKAELAATKVLLAYSDGFNAGMEFQKRIEAGEWPDANTAISNAHNLITNAAAKINAAR